MNSWFRFYNEALDDPKVQKLPPKLFKYWVNLLCLASKNDGQIPCCRDVAFCLRITEEQCVAVLAELEDRVLLHRNDNGYTPHSWENRQFKSDGSTERVQRFRERKRNVSETLHETGQTRTEQNRAETETEQNPPIVPLGQFSNVKLSEKQYAALVGRFGVPDTEQRIEALSEYMASRGKKYASHYATILTWDRKNGSQNGHKTKTDRNAEAARRLLSKLHPQNRSGRGGGDFGNDTGGLLGANPPVKPD